MSNPRSANATASVREQKLARVIDREVAPIWHDRFARLLMRSLPARTGTFVLDVHSGPGHTTAELLQRLDETSRVVALGRDPWLMQVAKTHVRPEWKRRVYFKAGDIDDVTGMGDDTYDLSVANLVLGEQVVDWKAALAELIRVTKPGGQVLATLPLQGTWDEVEELFEELLRDELAVGPTGTGPAGTERGMANEVVTLQKLRRRRPKPHHIVRGLEELKLGPDDYVLEHERFELLFRSGREFLFSPVIEHGPLRLWKAILGRAEQPQALFWRFKEVIDTYYAGRVLAVTVVAGLIRIRVPGPDVTTSFSADYWSRYPELTALWNGTSTASPTKPKPAKSEDDFFDLDLEIDMDEDEGKSESPADSGTSPSADSGSELGLDFDTTEVSAASELPPVDVGSLDTDADPFENLLDELDAEAAAAAAIAAENAAAEAEAKKLAGKGRGTLGDLGSRSSNGGSGLSPLPVKPSTTGSGASPLPSKPTAGGSGASLLPKPPTSGSGASPLPSKPGSGGSGVSPLPAKPPSGGSGVSPLPKPPTTGPNPAAPKPPATGSNPMAVKPPSVGAGSTTGVGKAPLIPQAPKVGAATPKPPVVTGVVPGKPAAPEILNQIPNHIPTPATGTPGSSDIFAQMLRDDDELVEEVDDLEELDLDPPAEAADDEEGDDLASSFGRIEPDPDNGRSGLKRVPPPPPTRKK